jgi:type III pantothenate kinase
MLLCIDIGNTNIKFGLFLGDDMKNHWRVATDPSKLADEYAVLMTQLFEIEKINFKEVHAVAISSVVPPLTLIFVEVCQKYLGLDPLMYEPKMNIGMRINTEYPAEVGPDLVMNALAAFQIYHSAVIIIGFGTATTFTAISEYGDLEGVAIAPGILTSANSLFRSAAALPQVALSHPKAAIGRNTMDSIRSGIVFGFVGLVESLIRRMKVEMESDAHVIATGGLASLIASETVLIERVEPSLALMGLKRLYEINSRKK